MSDRTEILKPTTGDELPCVWMVVVDHHERKQTMRGALLFAVIEVCLDRYEELLLPYVPSNKLEETVNFCGGKWEARSSNGRLRQSGTNCNFVSYMAHLRILRCLL